MINTIFEDSSNYIILSGEKHSNFINYYEYPDLLVSKVRLPLNNNVENALKQIKIEEEKRQITLYDSLINRAGINKSGNQNLLSPQGYLGYLRWKESHYLINKLDHLMLNQRQFFDFIDLLKAGIFFGKDVWDGNEDKVSIEELKFILDDIVGKRPPARQEHLDAKYELGKNGRLHICYNHMVGFSRISQEVSKNIRKQPIELMSEYSQILEFCLMKDCSIDLFSINKQGLPTREGKDIFYFFPCDGTSAKFIASGSIVALYCYETTFDYNQLLGVRPVRIIV